MSQSGSASHLTEANSITVDAAGTGSVVSAADGATLDSFTADVAFDVDDTAANIAAQITGTGKDGSDDEANSAAGLKWSAVTADDAAAIQNISGYIASGSMLI